MIDTLLASDSSLWFRKNYLKRIYKLITTTDDIDEKIYYDINRKAAKISTISSGKISKYEFLTGE